ncbi:hypothetical protein RHGRI_012485 [Rhododendron griersonianum]|uniref:Pentatricopeptide repeat-containing protein n=1 Tax=Rhododendron griersonianum TaxID=479676 RepID=A0AAV6KRQ9_9ERIC|nr:hypothetical protein RHGRI_012485 [Rhododendron griersonianum]
MEAFEFTLGDAEVCGHDVNVHGWDAKVCGHDVKPGPTLKLSACRITGIDCAGKSMLRNIFDRHELVRYDVKQVICSVCDTEQPVVPVCTNCGVNMGEYFCEVCKFYDDDIGKEQFHCNDCGICRVGGRENFFHCKKCGSCYSVALRDNHSCVENSMRHHCPICYEYLFDSLKDTTVMKCGHTMHCECYHEMIKRDKFCCPICSRSIIDMSQTWKRIDDEIEATVMPEDYRYKKLALMLVPSLVGIEASQVSMSARVKRLDIGSAHALWIDWPGFVLFLQCIPLAMDVAAIFLGRKSRLSSMLYSLKALCSLKVMLKVFPSVHVYLALIFVDFQLLIASEESHIVLRLVNGGSQTLDFIKDFVGRIADVFCRKPNFDLVDQRISEHNGVLPCALQDMIETVGDQCQLRTKNWFSRRKGYNNERESQPVFNVLDTLLKDSLERLKTMRECITWGHMGSSFCSLEANYTQHVTIIRTLCLEGKLGAAIWLKNKMIHNDLVPDIITHNYIVNALCKAGELKKADWLVSEMLYWGPSPTCATYNTLMKGYCLVDNVDRALDLFSTMGNRGVLPNRVTCNVLVHALCKKGLLEDAVKLLEEILVDNCFDKERSNLITSTILMDGYFKSGDTMQALFLWNDMIQRGFQMDVTAYNVVIHGSCLSQDVTVAYQYLSEMLKSGFLPDVFTYNTLISALCKEGKTDEACYIHSVMSRLGVFPDQISYKMLITGLCVQGDVMKASEFLLSMLESSIVPEPVIWNAIIDGYGRTGDAKKALSIRDQMVEFGVLPNIFTYNILIHAHIKRGKIAEAYSLKKEMILNGLFPDLVTYNLLVGAACGIGDIRSALQLHDEILRRGYNPDIITYTELIKGYTLKGKLMEAEKLFAIMQRSGIPIDHVPFLILMKKYCKRRDLDRAFDLYQVWCKRDK